MPILDGYEVCRQLRGFYDQEKKLFEVKHLKEVPIFIAFSGFVN
jgi:CheY-like chemotaxis protein